MLGDVVIITRACRNLAKDVVGKKYFSLLQTILCPQSGKNSTSRTAQISATSSRSLRLLNGRLSSSLDLDLLLRLLRRGLFRQRHREHVLLEACLDLLHMSTGRRRTLTSLQTAQ